MQCNALLGFAVIEYHVMVGYESCTEAVCKEKCPLCRPLQSGSNAPSPNLLYGKKPGITRSAVQKSNLARAKKS